MSNQGPLRSVCVTLSKLCKRWAWCSGTGHDSGCDVGPTIAIVADLRLDQLEKFGSDAWMLRLQIARHGEKLAARSVRDGIGEFAQQERSRVRGRGRVHKLVMSWKCQVD